MATGRELAVSVLLNARDQLTGSVRKARRMTDRLSDTVTRVGRNPGFARMRGEIRRTRQAVGGLVSSVGKVGKRLAFAGAGAATALAGMTASVAARGDDIAKFADQTGMGVEALQELTFAYDRMGVSESTLRSSLGAFSKRLGEARKEMGPLYAQLKDSNPELLEQLRNTENVADALAIYNRAIAAAPNQIDKAAMASAGFSRAGLEMVRATRDGVDEIDRLRGRARELGLVLSEETARDAEAFQDKLTNLKSAFGGLKNIIGGALLPVLSSVMDQATTLVVDNQQAVRDWAQQFAADLPARIESLKGWLAGLGDTVDRFIERAEPVIGVVQSVADRFGAMNTAVAAVTAIIAAPILAPLISLAASLTSLGVAAGSVIFSLAKFAGVGSVVKAGLVAIGTGIKVLGAALVANPVGAIIAGIAVAGLLIYRYWDQIVPFVRGLWDRVTAIVSGAYDRLVGWLGFDPLAIMRPVWNAVSGYVGGIFDALKALVGGDISAIGDLFAALNPLNLIRPAFNAARDWLAGVDWSGVGQQIIDTLVSGISSAAGRVKDAVVGAIQGAWDGAKNAGKGAMDAIGDGVRSAGDSVKGAAESVMQRVRDYMPGSDAKRGPLSDITRSGRALPTTFAGGVMDSEKALVGAVDRVMAAANDAVRTPLRRPAIEASSDDKSRGTTRIVPFSAPMRMPRATLPGATAAPYERPRPFERVTRHERSERETHTRELHHAERVIERAAQPAPIARSNGTDAIAAARAGSQTRTGRGTGPRIERIDNRFDVRIEPRDGASAMEIYDEFERRLQGSQSSGWRGVQDVPLEHTG